MLVLPVVDLRHDVARDGNDDRVETADVSPHGLLFVGGCLVVWRRGGVVVRRLLYDTPVVAAAFVHLGGPALVVVLASQASVYYLDGRTLSAPFPHPVARAFPSATGFVLETADHTLTPRFYSLRDPLDPLGTVVLSLVSTIPRSDSLAWFSRNNTSLAVTTSDHTLTVHHVREVDRVPGPAVLAPAPGSTPLKTPRKPYIAVPEDSQASRLDLLHIPGSPVVSRIGLRLPEDPLPPQLHGTRKDAILTKVYAARIAPGRVFGVATPTQEAVVAHNSAGTHATVLVFSKGAAGAPVYSGSTSIRCLSIAALNHPAHHGFLVVLVSPSTLHLVCPFSELTSPPIVLTDSHPPIASVLAAHSDTIVLMGTNGRVYTIRLPATPTGLIERCLSATAYLLLPAAASEAWLRWMCASRSGNDWDAWVAVVLASVAVTGDPTTSNAITTVLPAVQALLEWPFHSPAPGTTQLLLALHLIREDLKLDVCAQHHLDALGLLLAQLTAWAGWGDAWTGYYRMDPQTLDRSAHIAAPPPPTLPPNLMQSMALLFAYDDIVPYVLFSQVCSQLYTVDQEVVPRTFVVLRLLEVMVLPDYGAQDVCDMMVECGISRAHLDTFPAGVAAALKEYIVHCQQYVLLTADRQVLLLVSREDLLRFWGNGITPELVAALGGAPHPPIRPDMFPDRRLDEVDRLLQNTAPQQVLCADPDIVAQREVVTATAMRTLALLVGRALVLYGLQHPLVTEPFPLAPLCLLVTLLPAMRTLVPEPDTVPRPTSRWAHFHHGAAAGLSVARNAGGIGGSWVVFNRSSSAPSAEHAGFLLGLGLNGHLRKLEEWHVYNYLGPKHAPTSIGLLLGMAALRRGSQDPQLTKVLLVHVVALLPPGANDLNVEPSVQTAGLLGVGLVYAESRHRRMLDVLLSQISASVRVHETTVVDESYRLAAGLALGYVNLGSGNECSVGGLLFELAVAPKDFQTRAQHDKSVGGALCALMLIYLRSNDRLVAAKLAPPASQRLLDYVRPDLLVLRALGSQLVMYDRIGTLVEWVQQQVPRCLERGGVSYFYCVAGTCLAMGVCHVSSGNREVRDTILHFWEQAAAVSDGSDRDLHEVRVSLHMLGIAGALTMAGHGDLAVLRSLRRVHQGRALYGEQMAVAMAVGLLFVGKGQCAIDDSNLGVAALVTSLYPLFPQTGSGMEKYVVEGAVEPESDPRGRAVHLEALRHFWAMAVTPRSLVVRETGGGGSVAVPVVLRLVGGRVMNMTAPCLLPKLEEVEEVEVGGGEYFEVTVDLREKEVRERFGEKMEVWVQARREEEEGVGVEVMGEVWRAGVLAVGVEDRRAMEMELERMVEAPRGEEELWGLKLLFGMEGGGGYMKEEFVERLKGRVWEQQRM